MKALIGDVAVAIFIFFVGFATAEIPHFEEHREAPPSPSPTQLELLEQSERAAMAVQIVDSIFHELGEGPWRCEPLREADEDG